VFLDESPIPGNKSFANLRLFFKTLQSQGVLLSFIFALSIWLYTTLQNSFSIAIDVPVEIKLNEDQTIESNIPKYLTIEVKGIGWDLFNLKYFSKSQKCLLNLSSYPENAKSIVINYSKLLQSLVSLEQYEIKSISPESITLSMVPISKVQKPVAANINIEPRKGFIVVGKISLEPTFVEAKGYKNFLDSLDSIHTEHTSISDVHNDISGSINLINDNYPIIKINPKQVKYYADVEQRCDMMIKNVPVKIRGGILPNTNLIQNQYISVYISGGVDEIAKIDPAQLTAFINIEKVINDTTGILVPEIDLPDNIKLLKTDPPFIYHYFVNSGTLN
jgi:hypothetical protein